MASPSSDDLPAAGTVASTAEGDGLERVLYDRYTNSGNQTDLTEYITASRDMFRETPEDTPNRPEHLFEYGIALQEMHSRTGAMEYLEQAIDSTRQAIRGVAENDVNRPWMLYSLGTMLRREFSLTEGGLEPTEAIQVSGEAADAVAEDHPRKAQYLNNLGLTMANKFRFTMAANDLDDAIEILRRAAAISREDDPSWVRFLSDLGDCINDRWTLTNSADDLEEALEIARRAVENTPKDHQDRIEFVIQLADRRVAHYERTGSLSDLEDDIELLRNSLQSTPDDHPSRATLSNMLGNCHANRYYHLGMVADLDEAIKLARQAVDLTPKEDRNFLVNLSGLGVSLADRYERTRALADLSEAIEISTKVLQETPLGSSEWCVFAYNLGTHLQMRYNRVGAASDLDKAIELARAALAAPAESQVKPDMVLRFLGENLGHRFDGAGAIEDLHEAIEVGTKAMRATPRFDVDWPFASQRLAGHLARRYSQTNAISDLNEAIELATQAVGALGEHNRFRAGFLSFLGNLFGMRFGATEAREDRQQAILLFQTALLQTQSFIEVRIEAAKVVVVLCQEESMWQEAYEAARMAIDLIPQLALRSLQTSDKQELLAGLGGFASEGAALALRVGEEPFIALDLLEKGRGVIALSLEDVHTDITHLEETHPDLARLFVYLRSQLGGPDTAKVKGKSEWNSESNRSHEAAEDFEKLLLEIRQQPSFEYFLLAPTESEVKSAARYGPIVVVNCSLERCDAILVEQHQIRLVPLPRYNRGVMLDYLREGTFKSTEALEWLWHCIANPVLSALGFDQPPTSNNWPRVWWVMTGSLTRFPIHAAGLHAKGSSETVIDRVISSYHTSVQAIIRNRKRLPSPGTPHHAVLVAMENTPGNSPLPFASKEITTVRGLCESMSLNAVEPPPRKEDILSQLNQCNIFHFAGHAHTDSLDPTESYLCLDDTKARSLTVSNLLDINRQRGSPFLAYLSACGTGQIQMMRLSDEAIHLITGFQLAGFRHVIGTLWEVKDELCVDMARITYEELRDKALTDESVSWGLHKAARELRDRWLGETRDRGGSLWHVEPETKQPGEAYCSMADEGVRENRLPRDVIVCDEEHTWPPWIPYVHFGV
ncbi:CHAT domain-containing protein [Thelonectria olida]|uniref:CHAT domain-containing protein n=1 Tax=Thelonectria olida TaxID=1576542 RepID=A0A9P8VP08_9HYPO|nr:CHAT domain-containing protein [Thelonectria olida]